jgi:hypothetical protein
LIRWCTKKGDNFLKLLVKPVAATIVLIIIKCGLLIIELYLSVVCSAIYWAIWLNFVCQLLEKFQNYVIKHRHMVGNFDDSKLQFFDVRARTCLLVSTKSLPDANRSTVWDKT